MTLLRSCSHLAPRAETATPSVIVPWMRDPANPGPTLGDLVASCPRSAAGTTIDRRKPDRYSCKHFAIPEIDRTW